MWSTKKSGKLLMLEGAIFVFLGALAVWLPNVTTLAFEWVIGTLFILAGVYQSWRSFLEQTKRDTFFAILSAVLYFVTGVLIWSYPFVAALTLTLLLALFFIAEGVIKLAYSIRHRRTRGVLWLSISGILALAIGAIIWSGWPSTGLWFIGLLIGINMIFYGCTAIVIGSALCREIQ